MRREKTGAETIVEGEEVEDREVEVDARAKERRRASCWIEDEARRVEDRENVVKNRVLSD